ncbi:fasciclin domain-containing protein [Phenylobacterium sp.]|uniref:fasciclin domain-containing protein n=1 Tax=Phenylobacterium sp. TaxID=1871053 RepID=UPI002E2FDC2A|nr:fasciclin domain-containing protein [Phenylobacterium sp.]HEX3366938.1 fasciclin domain-containing protein [Phenylobacterium sp.]
MPIHRLLTAAAAVTLLAGAAMAQTPAPAAPPAAPSAAVAKLIPTGDLSTTLRASPNFTVFVKALDATNLSSLLKSSPGLTVFAPTDAAFPQSKLDSLMADKPGLQKFLLHYIINAKIDSSKIKGAHGGLPSGAGDKIVVDGTAADGTLKADNATIIQADVMASNGIIHVIDALMVAGSVPETLPEPPPEAAPATAPEPTPAAKPPAKKKK